MAFGFLDATFYDGAELGNRDMNLIPHPFVVESMKRFQSESIETKEKINFIHLNHTNPLLDPYSSVYELVLSEGFKIAFQGQRIKL